jgi:hypothetical protein
VASRAWCLQAAAMLACPAVFKMPMARLRRVAMAPVALAGGDRDVPPGQVLDLGVQAGLVLLDHQDVMGPLAADKEPGVLALGVQGTGGDDAPCQVQRLEPRREPGDLVGLAVHPDLAEHNTTALIEGGQKVHRLAAGAGVTGAPHRLAVHRDRPPAAPPVSCCPAGGVQPRIQPGPATAHPRPTRRPQ